MILDLLSPLPDRTVCWDAGAMVGSCYWRSWLQAGSSALKEVWRHLGLGDEMTMCLSLENRPGHEQAATCSLESPRTDLVSRIRNLTRGWLWVPLVATGICSSVPLDVAHLKRDKPQHSYLWSWLFPWAAVAGGWPGAVAPVGSSCGCVEGSPRS